MPTASDVFVDTSGWAYYLDRQDPLHPMIVALVKQAIIERRRLVTTNYILTFVCLMTTALLADKSAVGAVNRPLLGHLLCSLPFMNRLLCCL